MKTLPAFLLFFILTALAVAAPTFAPRPSIARPSFSVRSAPPASRPSAPAFSPRSAPPKASVAPKPAPAPKPSVSTSTVYHTHSTSVHYVPTSSGVPWWMFWMWASDHHQASAPAPAPAPAANGGASASEGGGSGLPAWLWWIAGIGVVGGAAVLVRGLCFRAVTILLLCLATLALTSCGLWLDAYRAQGGGYGPGKSNPPAYRPYPDAR